MSESPKRPVLEIAAQDIEGVRLAAWAGADRLELCQALSLGGLTPSMGLIQEAAMTGLSVRVLIRPRAGGYRYTPAETTIMIRDVAAACAAGAEGVVIGALTGSGVSDQELDVEVLAELIAAAEGKSVILHRCVDVLLGQGQRPQELVEQAQALGITGILTSGGAATASDGTAVIEQLTYAAGDQLEIIAGGGLGPESIARFPAAHAVHMSASGLDGAGPSGPGGGPEEFRTTDADVVAAARAAIDALITG